LRIQIDRHTLERAAERGVTLAEIEETVRTGQPIPAKFGRLAKSKVFPLASDWRGRSFVQKRVEVIYTVENEIIVTITVYAFYGRWGE